MQKYPNDLFQQPLTTDYTTLPICLGTSGFFVIQASISFSRIGCIKLQCKPEIFELMLLRNIGKFERNLQVYRLPENENLSRIKPVMCTLYVIIISIFYGLSSFDLSTDNDIFF